MTFLHVPDGGDSLPYILAAGNLKSGAPQGAAAGRHGRAPASQPRQPCLSALYPYAASQFDLPLDFFNLPGGVSEGVAKLFSGGCSSS